MRAQNNCERRQCLTYLESSRKKSNGHRQSFRKDETTPLIFNKGVITATFYGMNWKWQAYSTMHWFLAVRKSYVDCILAKPEECCCDDSVVKYISKVVFMLTLTT